MKPIAVAALSGHGEDLGVQTHEPMLGWGTEVTVIRCGDRNDELCFGTFSTVLLVQHRGLQLWMFYCEQWNEPQIAVTWNVQTVPRMPPV